MPGLSTSDAKRIVRRLTAPARRRLRRSADRYGHLGPDAAIGKLRGFWRPGVALAFVSCLLLAGCEGAAGPSVGSLANANSGATLTVTPASGARNQPASTEIGVALPGGRISTVALTDAAGKPVAGTVRADGTAWVPAQPLAYQTTYQATVTAMDAKGNRAAATTKFTTTPSPSGDPIVSNLDLQGGGVYGVGMPIVLDFSAPIPDGSKADVEHRLTVTSAPQQTGGWRWYGDRQVIYRPKAYWQPGTKLTISTTLGGLPVGGRYLDSDRSTAVTIGQKTTFLTTDGTKQMQVFQNDKLVKTFPVSLGAPDTPTSTGHMVIMTREPHALWVYSADDQLNVSYAERLTGDGEYIHSAPWSVADQGHDDVSHGCTNLSPENAEWVYNNSQVGDPVTVTGTGKHLAAGNGWTVWDMSWTDYVKGSAVHQQGLADRGTVGK